MAFRSKEGGEEIMRLFEDKFDLLLGRKTYEIFAAYWPYYKEDAPAGAIAKAFRLARKYVVSRSGSVDTSWENTVLLRDISDVNRIKKEDGPPLLTQGSTELVHALLANDMVDAISTFMAPVVLGKGKRLWVDGSAPHSFKLIRSRVTPVGVIIGHYERDGAVNTADGLVDPPSERELARRERLKREG
jgi:dihydrofolate reductase